MTRPDFDPAAVPDSLVLGDGSIVVPGRDGAAPHVWEPRAVLALRVALATARPLLVTGEPGVGKSTLARSAAAAAGWPLHEHVVTSRTQARDLMWRFDAVRRLAHAQADRLQDDAHYVRPGPLWWALDPDGAATRAGEAPQPLPPLTVVLVDEIDKADPDVPNDLLDALDRGRFEVDDVAPPIRVEGGRGRALMVITSNRERELPPAFLRRCVALHLPPPTPPWLRALGAQRFPHAGAALLDDVAQRLQGLRDALADDPGRKPGTAEYLDAVLAALELGLAPGHPRWAEIEAATLWKRDAPPPAAAAQG